MQGHTGGYGEDPENEERILNKAGSDISIGILSGGESSRMGRDKALVRIGNERFIDRLTAELGRSRELIISAARPGIYEETGYRVVYDEHAKIGPIEGIRRVLTEAQTEYVFVCAVDMPFVTEELVSYLAGYISSDHDCIVIADEDHIQPLCAIYSKRVLPVIEELIAGGRYRLREIFKRVRTKYVSLEYSCFDKKVVRNINTRQELAEISRPCVFCVSGYSDSGKTGLIVKLINEFIADGMTVGVIKHDGHDRIRDASGSDTELYRLSGAVGTAVFSESASATYFREAVSVETLIDQMKRKKAPPDVIILEGLKGSAYPKVEVIRGAVCGKSVCDPKTLICIASDCLSPESSRCPVFGPDDSRGIFLCLKEFFQL